MDVEREIRRACPDENELLLFLQATRAPDESETIESHLDECEACRSLLGVLVQQSWAVSPPLSPGSDVVLGTPIEEDSPLFGAGELLARLREDQVFAHLPSGCPFGAYRIDAPLGMGGMGVVYLAHDPELQRPFALKLMRPEADSAMHQARLQREARAMAQLSHPHIVTVFELGEFSGQLYIAMEYIEGTTLSKWLQEQEPSPERVVARFREAGEALAFAHSRGVVHRDFKPDNVLIHKDERAVVTDFGLASVSHGLADVGAPEASSVVDDDDMWRTQTGAMLGTPAYMSPEQIRGEQADHRSDQFSYCVALWEALSGCSPFVSREPARRIEEMKLGRWKGREAIPKRLLSALSRGLSFAPEHRYPTMDALLLHLSLEPKGVVRKVFAVFAAIVLLLVAVVVIQRQVQPAHPPAHRKRLPAGSAIPQRSTLVTKKTPLPRVRRVHRRQRKVLSRRKRPIPPIVGPANRRAAVGNVDPLQCLPGQLHGSNRVTCTSSILISQLHLQLLRTLQRGDLVKGRRVFADLRRVYKTELPRLPAKSAYHLVYAKAMHNRGLIALFSGSLSASRRYLQDSLRRQETVFGAKHLALATTQLAASMAHVGSGQMVKARRMLGRASHGLRSGFGERHYAFAQSVDVRALLDWKAGAHQKALSHQQLALRIFARTKDTRYRAIAMHNLGLIWMSLGQFKKARKHLSRAVFLLERTLAPGHFMLGVALYNLGRCLVLYEKVIPARTLHVLRRSARILHGAIGVAPRLTRKGWSLIAAVVPKDQPGKVIRFVEGTSTRTPDAKSRQTLARKVRALWLYQPLLMQ